MTFFNATEVQYGGLLYQMLCFMLWTGGLETKAKYRVTLGCVCVGGGGVYECHKLSYSKLGS